MRVQGAAAAGQFTSCSPLSGAASSPFRATCAITYTYLAVPVQSLPVCTRPSREIDGSRQRNQFSNCLVLVRGDWCGGLILASWSGSRGQSEVLAGDRTYNGGDGEQQVREIDQFLSILQLLFLIVQEYQVECN